jgi:hypothetical protein
VALAESPRAGMLAPSQLASRLQDALGRMAVASDGRSGSVGGRNIEADSPAEFTHRLSYAIYEVLHVGWEVQPPDAVRTSTDEGFELRLAAATPHASVMRTAGVVAADAGRVFVELDGVRVVIPRAGTDEPAQPGDQIAVRLPSVRPALSPGYWVADGTRALGRAARIVRLYVHLTTSATALAAWEAVLAMLEERGLAFRAKVTSVPGLLPRRDALVVYADDSDLEAVLAIGRQIGSVTKVGPEVSVFTDPIAPGVAIAWEPADPRPAMRGLSFGEHRARAVADGVVRHARSSDGSTVAESVRLALIEAGINPARPAAELELGSPGLVGLTAAAV